MYIGINIRINTRICICTYAVSERAEPSGNIEICTYIAVYLELAALSWHTRCESLQSRYLYIDITYPCMYLYTNTFSPHAALRAAGGPK